MNNLIKDNQTPGSELSIYNIYESPILYIRAKDDVLIDVGVQPGDMLVIDQSKKPLSGDIVLAKLNGQILIHRLSFHFGKAYLIPENSKYKIICVGLNDDFLL